jgi:hypothetical protein
MPDYYAVVTFKKGATQIEDFTASFQKWLKDKPQVILVREFGRKGDNPHLNLVINARRKDNLERDLANLYKKAGMIIVNTEEFKTIKVIRIDDIQKLVNYYLEKEENREVLTKRGYDLPPPVKRVFKKDKALSMGEKMLQVMPVCRDNKLGHHWNESTILSWVYDYCVEHKISAIPSVFSKLSTLALQERLPTIDDGSGSAIGTKQKLKDLTIKNFVQNNFL